MKLHTETREVGRFGTSQETKFSIAASPKAFRALSKTLYSDGILAVIRELSCNAYDAHVEAGNTETPFEVHLPNRLEPWFAVTDYGIGLDHDAITKMYSTYFESTKTDSNAVTGCFGLGSKSPFAYVDAFTVEARWNGKLTIYSCFYNEEGIPSIAMMGEPMDTDAHNGLTVKMPVKDGDFRAFAERAMRALNRFNPTPTVTGNTDYRVETIEYTMEGTNWRMIKDGSYSSYRSNIHAIQGNVTYPISQDSMSSINLTSAQRAIMTLPVDIFFEIGDLEVALSREALEYTEETVANIRDALDRIADELPPLYQDRFNDCKTLWEAKILFKDIVRDLPSGVRTLLSDKDVGLKWRKQTLDEDFVITAEDFKHTIIMFERGSRGNRGSKVDPDWKGNYKFSAGNDVLFFYDDVGHGSHSRVSYFLETSNKAARKNFLIKTAEKKVLKALSKSLGQVNIQPVSNLPKRPKAIRAAARVTSKVLEYAGKAHDRRDSWNPTEIDLKNDSGVYVVINRFKVFNDGGEVLEFDSICELAQTNNLIDLNGQSVYGIRSGDVAKLPADTKWVNMFELIRKNIKDVVAKENISQILADSTAFSHFNFDLEQYSDELIKESFDAGSPMAEFIKAYKYMKERKSDRASAIRNVGYKVGYKIEESQAKYDLNELWKAVEDQYPLMKVIDQNQMRGGYYYSRQNDGVREKNFKHLMEYMRLIDKSTKTDADDTTT